VAACLQFSLRPVRLVYRWQIDRLSDEVSDELYDQGLSSQAQPVTRPVQLPSVISPAPRATLVRLPSPELGVYRWYGLPEAWGGGKVKARYLGTKEFFSQIPPNPVPGDILCFEFTRPGKRMRVQKRVPVFSDDHRACLQEMVDFPDFLFGILNSRVQSLVHGCYP
jgi:hypothetical protein